MKLTQEKIYQYGSELRRIMQTDAFKAAVKLTQTTYQQEFFNTPYGDSAAREQAYRKSVALNDLLESFNAFVTNAQMQELEDDE